MRGPVMEIIIEEELLTSENVILHLKGSLDHATYADFRSLIESKIRSGIKNMLLDMKEVKYVSSSGVGVMVWGKNALAAGGGSMGIYQPQVGVRRVLEIIRAADFEWTLENLTEENPFRGYIMEKESLNKSDKAAESQASHPEKIT